MMKIASSPDDNDDIDSVGGHWQRRQTKYFDFLKLS